MAVTTEINTLEISIKADANSALSSLDKLAAKLDEIAAKLDKTGIHVGKIRNIGKVNGTGLNQASKGVENLGNAMKDTAKEADEMAKKCLSAQEKIKSAWAKGLMSGSRRDRMAADPNTPAGILNPDARTAGRARMEQNRASGMLNAKEFFAKQKIAELEKNISQSKEMTAAYNEQEAAIRKNSAALWDRARAAWNQVSADSDEIAQLQRSATSHAALAAAIRGTAAVAGAFAGTIWRLYQVMAHLTSGALRGLISGLRRLPGMFMKAASSAVSFGKALAHPIRSIKEMLGLDKRQNNGILGGLLGNRSLAKYIGLIALRRAVTAAIRAIVKGIKEGFENIMKYSSEVQSSVYSMQNSLLYLKNAWAAAFAPIVTAVAPYIDAFIDMIAAALNAIGRLMAILTGKGFAVQAKKLSDSLYAAGQAGESAAGGTGKAAKAAEEYKKTIMGFDQLNVLNSPNESGSSGGSGGGGGSGSGGLDANSMFETVELTGSLKDLIDAGNWDAVGSYAAEKINGFISKIDEAIKWDTVGGKITDIVTAFTTFSNALVRDIHWDELGSTVGDGVNTIVNTFNLLYEGINFHLIGSQLAVGVKGLVDTVQWENVGQLWTQKFQALWDTIHGFVSELPWGSIGDAVGRAFNGAIQNLTLGTVGESIGLTLDGATVTLKNFTLKANWTGASGQVSDFIQGLFGTVTADDMLSAASGLVTKFATALSIAITDPKTKTAIHSFASDLGSYFGSNDFTAAFGALTTLGSNILSLITSALRGAVTGLTENGGWASIGTSLGTAVNQLFTKNVTSDSITNLLKDALRGISITLENFSISLGSATELGEKLAAAISGGINAITQSGIVSAVFGLGKKIISALTNALTDPATQTAIKDFMFQFGNELAKSVPDLTNLALAFIKAFAAAIAGLEQGVRAAIFEALGVNVDTLTQMLSGTAPTEGGFVPISPSSEADGAASAGGFLSGVFKYFSENGSNYASSLAPFGEMFLNALGFTNDRGKQSGKDFTTGNKTGIDNNKETVKKSALDLSNTIFNGMGNMGEKGTTKGKAFGKGNDTGLRAWMTKLGFAGEDLSKKINNGMGVMSDQGKTKGSAFGGGVKTGIDNQQKDVKSSAATLAKGAVDAYNDKLSKSKIAAIKWELKYSQYNGNNYPSSGNPKISYEVPYAAGGFPPVGELFLSREAGPELVGRMGNKNVVANNQQIVDGIREGVYQAMVNAMASSNSGNGNGMPYEINVTVKTQNDEVLARAVERGQAKRKYRLGMAMG